MRDYSYLPPDVREYVYDDEIVIDLNNGYKIPRVADIINEIKSKGFNIKMYEDSETAIVIRPKDFIEIEKLIDMPYSL